MVIRSPSGGFVYLTPEAAMANLQALQRREAVKQWRQSIKEAFGCKCAYCGVKSEQLTLDHIHPKTKGGEDLATNIVPACQRCNHRKGDQTPEEAGMTLRRKPVRPSHAVFLKDYLFNHQGQWDEYLT